MTIFDTLELSDKGVDKHRRIAEHLAGLIANGTLAAGDRLPPVRPAAWSIGVHPGTVARAYKSLEARGLAHGEVGRGTFIGGQAGTRASGMPMESGERDVIDLTLNRFSIATPRAALAEAFEMAAARLRDGTLETSYAHESGRLADREAILPWLISRLGELQPEQVLITTGGQSALHSALSAFAGAGSAAACDALTYPGTIAAAMQLAIPLVGIAMDDEGVIPQALDEACRRRRISVLMVSPGINNPTGITMPATRREAIAEVALRHGLIVVEDEVYGFLGDERLPSFVKLLPLQGVHLQSLSKIVAPALRVGYLAGPSPLVRRAALAHKNSQMMVSPILAFAASHIAASGLLDRRRAFLIDEVAHRYRAASALLGLSSNALRPSGLLWLQVPEQWRPGDFSREAERQGVRVSPADLFAVDAGNLPHAVRLSLTAEADLERLLFGIDIIARLLRMPNPAPSATL